METTQRNTRRSWNSSLFGCQFRQFSSSAEEACVSQAEDANSQKTTNREHHGHRSVEKTSSGLDGCFNDALALLFHHRLHSGTTTTPVVDEFRLPTRHGACFQGTPLVRNRFANLPRVRNADNASLRDKTFLFDETAESAKLPLLLEGSLMKLWRNVVRFFADCLDALRDDEQTTPEQRRYEASLRQRRWLDYLSSPRA